MKKHIIWSTILFLSLFYIAPSVLNEYRVEGGEEQFLEGAIFDEASAKFDVHAMGISKEQQIVSVRTFNEDLTDEIESYFKKQLILHGMRDYKIEVYAEEKEDIRN